MKIDQARKCLEINVDKARALGVRFCGERNSRKLSTQDVADLLLLSKLQIIGLETGDMKSFYSAKMYGQAADKYAMQLGFDDKPSDSLFETDRALVEITDVDESNVNAAISTNIQSVETNDIPAVKPAIPKQPISLRTALIALLTAGTVVATFLITRTQEMITGPQPEPTAKTTETTPPIAPPTTTTETASAAPDSAPTNLTPLNNATQNAESAKSDPAPKPEPVIKEAPNSIPRGHIQIAFQGTSWVQSVDINGEKQEKTYRSGDTLSLEAGKLQALVIGNASAVTMADNKGEISLKPYIATGSQVARIIGPDVRKLAE